MFHFELNTLLKMSSGYWDMGAWICIKGKMKCVVLFWGTTDIHKTQNKIHNTVSRDTLQYPQIPNFEECIIDKCRLQVSNLLHD